MMPKSHTHTRLHFPAYYREGENDRFLISLPLHTRFPLIFAFWCLSIMEEEDFPFLFGRERMKMGMERGRKREEKRRENLLTAQNAERKEQ